MADIGIIEESRPLDRVVHEKGKKVDLTHTPSTRQTA